ncbi:Mlp family lipoprotein (plasmid) [Borrelia hermsii]|nr:Mlp family lipoprotein [Borrelia hermsii]
MDCKVNKNGNGTNEIKQFFRGILNDIFTKDNSEEMFECLKKRASMY